MFEQPSDAHNGASSEGASAEDVEARFAVLRSVSGEDVEIQQSMVQQVAGHDVELDQSVVGLVGGENVALDQSISGVTVGRNVAVNGGVAVFLLAPTVRGNVRTLFNVRSALALGAGYVLARQIIRLLQGRFR